MPEIFTETVAHSDALPAAWRAQRGQLTPNGNAAVLRSNAHAAMAIRLLYLDHSGEGSAERLSELRHRYESAWETYQAHGLRMQAIVTLHECGEIGRAAADWNQVDQHVVDDSYRTVIGEREEHHKGVSLLHHARRYFGVLAPPAGPDEAPRRDRRLRPSDSTAAWLRSPGGLCRGCGTPTISHAQRSRLHASFKKTGLFDLEPSYAQHHGVRSALWPQVTIAGKGAAEHVIPWSLGGLTSIGNLTNACAACNYSRGNTSMDAMGVAAYDRLDAQSNATSA